MSRTRSRPPALAALGSALGSAFGSALAGATLASVTLAACASVSSAPAASTARGSMSAAAPSPDPRVGLAAGRTDSVVIDGQSRRVITQPAAEAIWNLRLLSATPSTQRFNGVTNSDLAFQGDYVFQGSYNGYQVWDIRNAAKPSLLTAFYCPASQSDVSVYKNLLFVSAEGQTGRRDCSGEGVPEAVSAIRVRGVRIFDITDVKNPKYVKDVQTCRGSHTHSVLVPPVENPDYIYVYVSGSAGVRPEGELTGCEAMAPDSAGGGASSESFRIEVIRVPVARPQDAAVVTQPRIFQDLAAPPPNAARTRSDSADRAAAQAAAAQREAAEGANPVARRRGGGGGRPRGGPTQCHDITLYPAVGLAGGACGGYGLLLDISDPANPKRVAAVADSNFSFWHSATFSNDGSKMLFTDEWGGGTAPRCRASDKPEWGADAIFTRNGTKLDFKSYYKLPAAQTAQENCVAHNGSLIPIPGREVMVQGWYQGGISIFDWTDPSHAYEIAYHDRGPVDGSRLVSGGSWSVYWYNGLIVNSEIARGLDIFELVPSAHISQNEIDAAKTVRTEYLNAQGQPKFVWPPSFALARAYLDQLERKNGLAAERIAAARAALATAEGRSGDARRAALTALATELHAAANGAGDAPKVHTLAGAVGDLANAR